MCELAADGYLYVVPEEIPGTTNLSVRLYRIGPGGSPVEEFGDAPLWDIDSIVIDRTGAYSGIPGAVFTAGANPATGIAAVFQITPAGHITTFLESSALINPDVSGFDSSGRLIQTDYIGGVYAIQTNRERTQVVSDQPIGATAVDALGRLVCSPYSGGNLRLYSSTGQLLDAHFAPTRPSGFVRPGQGSFWGTDVYTCNTNGDLVRVDTNGAARVFGTGFGTTNPANDNTQLVPTLASDDNMYVCDKAANRIWRIAPLRASIRVSAVDICWNSQSNKNYQVQYRSDLTTNDWVNLGGSVAGTGTVNCITDPLAPGQPQRFYRVVEAP
jgi:sugar lactone lactonase YvrE